MIVLEGLIMKGIGEQFIWVLGGKFDSLLAFFNENASEWRKI